MAVMYGIYGIGEKVEATARDRAPGVEPIYIGTFNYSGQNLIMARMKFYASSIISDTKRKGKGIVFEAFKEAADRNAEIGLCILDLDLAGSVDVAKRKLEMINDKVKYPKCISRNTNTASEANEDITDIISVPDFGSKFGTSKSKPTTQTATQPKETKKPTPNTPKVYDYYSVVDNSPGTYNQGVDIIYPPNCNMVIHAAPYSFTDKSMTSANGWQKRAEHYWNMKLQDMGNKSKNSPILRWLRDNPDKIATLLIIPAKFEFDSLEAIKKDMEDISRTFPNLISDEEPTK